MSQELPPSCWNIYLKHTQYSFCLQRKTTEVKNRLCHFIWTEIPPAGLICTISCHQSGCISMSHYFLHPIMKRSQATSFVHGPDDLTHRSFHANQQYDFSTHDVSERLSQFTFLPSLKRHQKHICEVLKLYFESRFWLSGLKHKPFDQIFSGSRSVGNHCLVR